MTHSVPHISPPEHDAEAIAAEFKEYAYTVSHDLSNPVRAMVEFSKILNAKHADSLDEDSQEFLALIVNSGEKLQRMMDALLDYSRLNTMEKPFEKCDANEIVQHCIAVLSETYPNCASHIKVEKLPDILADKEQITQLFTALLDNALKFQPAGQEPEVLVSAKQEGDMLKFTVQDNGIGIKPEFFERVFKLLKRLHTDDEYPGVGIGLPLAQKIVNRHGGSIWVESQPTEGSSFCFTLPCPK